MRVESSGCEGGEFRVGRWGVQGVRVESSGCEGGEFRV